MIFLVFAYKCQNFQQNKQSFAQSNQSFVRLHGRNIQKPFTEKCSIPKSKLYPPGCTSYSYTAQCKIYLAFFFNTRAHPGTKKNIQHQVFNIFDHQCYEYNSTSHIVTIHCSPCRPCTLSSNPKSNNVVCKHDVARYLGSCKDSCSTIIGSTKVGLKSMTQWSKVGLKSLT